MADIQLDLGITGAPDRYPTLDEVLDSLSRQVRYQVLVTAA